MKYATGAIRAIAVSNLCFLLSGCAPDSTEVTEDGRAIAVLDQGAYEQAWERYRSSAQPTEIGGWVIEGDLYFASVDNLRSYFDERMSEDVDKAHAFQQISTGFVPAFPFPTNTNIRYCVSDDFAGKASWVTAVANAARAWEAVANVRFTYMSGFDSSCSSATSGVDFAVIRIDGLGGYYACNKLLWDEIGAGCFGGLGTLGIDPGADPTVDGAAPNVTVTGALRHELGHMLGLRHEHPWRTVIDPPCDEAQSDSMVDSTGVQLTTVPYDQLSVMHYPFDGTVNEWDCGGSMLSDFSLTVTDGHSMQALYGMHPAWFVALM